MKIEFYNKRTGELADNRLDIYFVRGDGSVWCDNGKTWESYYGVIGFEDCCDPCPELTWRVVLD